MNANDHQLEFLHARIKALETENERLNNELRFVKRVVSKTKLSDPIYLKPLSEIETNYQIVKP
jgi:hypothetical protein